MFVVINNVKVIKIRNLLKEVEVILEDIYVNKVKKYKVYEFLIVYNLRYKDKFSLRINDFLNKIEKIYNFIISGVDLVF